MFYLTKHTLINIYSAKENTLEIKLRWPLTGIDLKVTVHMQATCYTLAIGHTCSLVKYMSNTDVNIMVINILTIKSCFSSKYFTVSLTIHIYKAIHNITKLINPGKKPQTLIFSILNIPHH